MAINLTVDIGNTIIKAAVFNGRSLVTHAVMDGEATSNLQHYADELLQFAAAHGCTKCVVSDVRGIGADLIALLGGTLDCTMFTTAPGRLRSRYATQQTLGADRWAAALALNRLCDGKPAISIDAGTCLTVDVVDNGEYLGGSISPGAEMRLQAMHEHTGRLPLAESMMPEDIYREGRTTDESLRRGVWFGLVKEVEGYINYYIDKFDAPTVAFTGGYGEQLMQLAVPRGKCALAYIPQLVHMGLNEFLVDTHD